MNPSKTSRAKEVLSLYLERSDLELCLQGTIYGHLPSGKNRYRMSTYSALGKPKKPEMYKEAELGLYADSFMWQALKLVRSFKDISSFPVEGEVALYSKVFFQSMRRDLDTILFCDLLQKNGIVKNDRAIRIKFLDGIHIDPKNPRVEFELYKLGQANDIGKIETTAR